ncbi:MAG TPA: hypothetical protein VGG46_06930 [Terriglobales bacterium]|jgi:hypothetical protein
MLRCAIVFSLVVCCSFPAISQAQANSNSNDDSAGRLPVKRVVLYKNGVGYFEHMAHVHGTQDLSIDFTTSQLNDVLKSLTAVDLGGGSISSVRYNSIAPLDERLKSLRLPFGQQITSNEFLNAMRGSRVEAHNASSTATGRLLSVEQVQKQVHENEFMNVTQFSVLTDTGELQTFEMGPGTSVRLADHEVMDEVGHYLNLISSSRARDVRRMSLTASGNGDRDVFVSYISEVPVWKSTYRILISDKPGEKPLLQGWAIVDNTIGEDWKDVQLSLIAGSPQSFVQDISQPLYARRPVVPLPQSVMLTPQAQEATLKDGSENQAAAPPPPPPMSMSAGVMRGNGNGRASKSLTMEAIQGRDYDHLADYAKLANAPDVAGKAIGDYFEYDIKQKITIDKNQSALVPILQSPIEAQKVTLWNADSQPLRALWVKNTSGQILDEGTFNVLDADTFAGEGIMDSIHPDERRLLSYAADPAVHVKPETLRSDKPYSHVRIYKGTMMMTQEQREKTKYTIHDADTASRQVVIEYPARAGWELTKDSPKPEETTESYLRFTVPVEGGKTVELNIESFHPELTQFLLTNLNSDQVAYFSQQNRVTPEMRQIFQRIMAQKNKISGFDQQINQRKQEGDQISSDQARIRENMKALRGGAEEHALLQRYTAELNTQEDKLAALRKETAELQAQRNQANSELETMIMNINLDENL